ncbi:hypothetical protein CFS9_24550 [Flavobacterium sp. CFS9]|uniref:Uncharacterized protein n=1 Tax=Flavobacterium sp. CFS9 TaxID=3143118 RepID=A0AAT9H223_9FLAO
MITKCYKQKKTPLVEVVFYLVAGTGLEPVSAAADMSPISYNFWIRSLINSLPIPVFKYFSLFIASDLELKNSK